ncbi:MAG: FAD-dependent monooxygenase [Pseudomonadota bacterium]
MTQALLIAGGGIGGLAAALAARRAGWQARLFEQAEAFSEVGAGIQLGPNATRILREWELLDGKLDARVARPGFLSVREASDGGELGRLRLQDFAQRYGAPYFTVHRADLQQALRQAAQDAGAVLVPGRRIESVQASDDAVHVDGGVEGDALVVADGVFGRLRQQVIGGDAPHFTGHVAYRALVRQDALPQALRSGDVTVWLGPRLHLVRYPVRGGEFLNVVCLVEGRLQGDPRSWDQDAALADLQAAMGPACTEVRDLVAAIAQWRLWALHGRAPVSSAGQMAHGRIALLGDAAHPMLPYLAQGAGMALEDARELQRVLAVADGRTLDVPTALRRYALSRWQRVARVQARSQRNATIFHARGLLRLARNASIRLLGERVLDVPWLYQS